MRKVFLFDSMKCTGCRTCEMICSLRHTETCNSVRSRIRIVHNHKEELITLLQCRLCKKPPCVEVCPEKALSIDRDSGVINVDQDLCSGCLMCIEVCPFGGMQLDPISWEVNSCDLCGGEPGCVEFCETGAIKYVRADEIGMELSLLRTT